MSSDSGSIISINETLKKIKNNEPQLDYSIWWIVVILLAIGLFYYFYKYFPIDDNNYNNENDNNINNQNNLVYIENPTKPIESAKKMNVTKAGIIDLSGQQAESLMNQQPIVVAFVSKNCGHCNTMKADYFGASQMANQTFYTLYDDKPDASKLLQHFQIRGFPTIYLIYKGKVMSEYKGNRKANDIAKWATT